MKHIFSIIFAVCFLTQGFSQSKKTVKKTSVSKVSTKSVTKQAALPSRDLEKVKDSIPDLIPQRSNGLLGFVNQKGKVIIPHEYNFGTFFWEDCNLLNSPNEKLRKFGTDQYASVTIGENDYRIDKSGKRAYTFKNEDLGKCPVQYKEKSYFVYMYRGFYGVVNNKDFSTPDDSKTYQIYPQYQYLSILESADRKNPMIVASVNDRFGVIDIHNRIIIPFEYTDIKRNFSWRMAQMFEVTKDGKNYYFIDADNKGY